KETPSQPGSEAFLIWYLQNMKTLWEQNLVPALPALKSITSTQQFQADTENVKIISEWQPICKPFSFLSQQTWPAVAAVEASSAFHDSAQVLMQGKTDSRTALTNLQKGIVDAAKTAK